MISIPIPIAYILSSSGERGAETLAFFELADGLERVARITPTLTTMIDNYSTRACCEALAEYGEEPTHYLSV
jgi:hypothetical protein